MGVPSEPAAGLFADRPLSFRETRTLLRADHARLRNLAPPHLGDRSVAFSPAFLCVVLHRLAHLLFRRGHRFGARLLWQCNLTLTGADISPHARIGPGLVILFPVSCIFYGCAGARLTILPTSGVGGGLASDDIGAGPGLPLIGDDVVLGYNSMVLGPVHVGDGAVLESGATAVRDVPAGARVLGPAMRIRS